MNNKINILIQFLILLAYNGYSYQKPLDEKSDQEDISV